LDAKVWAEMAHNFRRNPSMLQTESTANSFMICLSASLFRLTR
jgi:hypothetical protein